jgi:hypothetical protein
MKKKGLRAAMQVLETEEKTARDLCLHGDQIQKNLLKLNNERKPLKHQLNEFKINWTWDQEKTLVLLGATNMGKSSLAKALLPRALWTRHLDRLKEYRHNPPRAMEKSSPQGTDAGVEESQQAHPTDPLLLPEEDLSQESSEISTLGSAQTSTTDSESSITEASKIGVTETRRELLDMEEIEEDGNWGIIFDDMSFAHLHREAQLAIVDVYDDTDIHIRYSVAHLPAGTPRIVTSNRNLDEIFLATDDAIRRRLQVIDMKRIQTANGFEFRYTDILKTHPMFIRN